MNEPYREGRAAAQDGLRLYYRDYGDPLSSGTPVLCLSGLTRNCIDFHDLAVRLAPNRRVICPDYRGRGRSEYDPNWRNYTPQTYLSDLGALLTAVNCHRVLVIGTSLGGLLAMALAVSRPAALAGVILNDIGPQIEKRGVARIASYVGAAKAFSDLDAAARHARTLFGPAYPDFTDEDWHRFAAKGFRRNGNGEYAIDYDPALSRALRQTAEENGNLWPYFGALRAIPTLALRGGLSDILSEETFERMAAAKPDLMRVQVPNRGHVPLLDEPACLQAIEPFIAQVDLAAGERAAAA